MTLCRSGLPAGINLECLAYPSPVDNVIITDVDVSFTEATIKLLSSWKTEVQVNLDAWIPSMIEGYEVTTDDPTINTTGMGRKTMVRKPPPSAVMYIRSNICDFAEVLSTFKSNTVRVFHVLADGTIHGYKDRNSSNVYGFKAEISAATKGVPVPDTIENAFPLYINYMNYSEFEQQYAFTPEWSVISELPPAMPQGYSLSFVSGTQATATVVVNVFEQCGDAVTGLATGDIEVIESTLTDDTVASVTDNGDGNFDIAFTTAALNQDIKFRIKETTATVVDAISNEIYHEFIA